MSKIQTLTGRIRAVMARTLAELEGAAGPAARYLGLTNRRPTLPVRLGLVPALVAGHLAESPPARASLVCLGAAVELVYHSATTFDDLQDKSPKRGNQPSVWSVYGQDQAMNVGVWLLSAAHLAVAQSRLAPAQLGPAHTALARAVGEMTRGQWQDLDGARPGLDACLACGQLKTGGLIALALQWGGIAAGVDARAQKALAGAGHRLGEALQLHDDVEDLLEGFAAGTPQWTALLAAIYPYLEPAAQGQVDAWLAAEPAAPEPAAVAALLRQHGAAQVGLVLAEAAARAGLGLLQDAGLTEADIAAVTGAMGLKHG